jgi:glutaredoxin 3
MVIIFGKDNCPYTQAAIEDCTDRGVAFEYVDVTARRADLDRMLVHSQGRRRVPVIVDGDKVTMGFGGT